MAEGCCEHRVSSLGQDGDVTSGCMYECGDGGGGGRALGCGRGGSRHAEGSRHGVETVGTEASSGDKQVRLAGKRLAKAPPRRAESMVQYTATRQKLNGATWVCPARAWRCSDTPPSPSHPQSAKSIAASLPHPVTQFPAISNIPVRPSPAPARPPLCLRPHLPTPALALPAPLSRAQRRVRMAAPRLLPDAVLAWPPLAAWRDHLRPLAD